MISTSTITTMARSTGTFRLLVVAAAALLLYLVYTFKMMSREEPSATPALIMHAPVIPDGEKERVLSELSKPEVAADDPRLVEAVRKYVIDHPRPYLSKFSYPPYYTPQAKAAMEVLNKKNGFFVECGGLDGERSSNTIYLENKFGWSGLLIEMDPSWYMQLRGKNRKSYSANVCLSPNSFPTTLQFKEHEMGQGKLVGSKDSKDKTVMKTFCFPLYTLMLALNRTHIDYFSLDVEGFEMPILSAIPFDKLDISVMSVEYVHGKGGAQAYKDLMVPKGYKVYKDIKFFKPEIYLGVTDLVFVKNGIL